jgi:hypothetical protein
MVATPNPNHIRYRQTSPPGAGQYEVLHEDVVIGRVGRFQMGAGQFGSRWIATTPRRQRSGMHMTRHAAATWLVEQARASGRS